MQKSVSIPETVLWVFYHAELKAKLMYYKNASLVNCVKIKFT